MASAFVQNLVQNTNTISSATIALTTGAAVTAGNHIVATVSGGSGATLASVSGGGLTWNMLVTCATVSGSSAVGIAIAHCPAGLASGTTITATQDASTTRKAMSLDEFSGLMSGNPVDQVDTVHQPGTGISWVSGTTATVTQSGEMLIGAFSHNDPNLDFNMDTGNIGVNYTDMALLIAGATTQKGLCSGYCHITEVATEYARAVSGTSSIFAGVIATLFDAAAGTTAYSTLDSARLGSQQLHHSRDRSAR